MTSKITIYKSLLTDEVLLETSTSEETLSKALFAIKKLHGEYVIVYVNDVLVLPDDWYIYKLEAFDDIRIVPDPAIGAVAGAAIGALISAYSVGVLTAGTYFLHAVAIAAMLKGAAIGYALGSVVDSIINPPDMPALPSDTGSDPSYGWSGPSLVIQPEGPVPVTYGQFLTGGTLIMQNVSHRSWDEGGSSSQEDLSPDRHAAVTKDRKEKFLRTGWTGWNGAALAPTGCSSSSYVGDYCLVTTHGSSDSSGIELKPAFAFTTVTGRKYKVSLAIRANLKQQDIALLWTCGDGATTIRGGKGFGLGTSGAWRECSWIITETNGGSNANVRIYIGSTGVQENDVYVYASHLYYDNISIKEAIPSGHNYISMLINLGEGPIEGIMKSDLSGVCTSKNDVPYILVNGQPFTNFEEIDWDYRLGTWNQTVIDFFHETTTYFYENRKITKGAPVTYTGTGLAIDGFEAQFVVPALFKIDGNGNTVENTITYQLEYRIIGEPAWIDDGEHLISGKSKTQVYAYVKKSNLTSGKYEIRITRITPEYTGFKESGDLYLQGVVEIVYENIAYRNSALLALQIKATDQLSGSTPNITTMIRGKTVLVPDLQISSVTQKYDDCYWDDDASIYKLLSFAYVSSFFILFRNSDPQGITTDGVNIWIVDATKAKVYKYTIAGTYVSSFDISTQSSDSQGVAVSSTHIWIVDKTTKEVYKYWKNGTYVSSFDISTQSSDSQGVAVSSTHIWIVDKTTKEVYKYWKNGTYVSSFDISTQSSDPQGITTDGVNIWIVDATEAKVYKYTIAGAYVSSFDISAQDNTGNGIATDGTNIWIVAARKVYKYMTDRTCTDTGNFVQQWSRHPVWCSRDFITNSRCGLGEYIEGSDWDNTAAAIEAKHCWELVTDFDGGTEHRFEMDLSISRFMSAPSAKKLLSRCFRGNIIWSNGKNKPVIDRARDPVQLFNEGNIVPGSLKTSYLKASQIPNFVEVQYADPNRNYDINAIEVVDEDEWTSVKPLRRDTINAKGTTRASEILRTGRYYLNCGKGVTKIHEFDCDLDAVHCEPGDVAQIQNDLIGWGVGGRIISATSSSVTTNIDVTYTVDYTIRIRLSNGDLEVKTVTSISNNNRTLNISGTFTSIPLADSVFAYGATDVDSKPFKVKTMTLIDNSKCKLILAEESANKYNDTTNVSLPVPIYTTLPVPTDPPDNVTDLVLAEMTKEPGFWISFNIPSESLTFDHADVLMSLDSKVWEVYRANVRENANIEVKDGILGQTYYVKVVAYNSRGMANLSSPVASITLTTPGFKPPDITGLQLDREGHDLPAERLIFYQKDARFKWNKLSNVSGAGHLPAGQEALGAGETVAEVNYTYWIEIWVSGSKVRTEKGISDPRYIYTYEKNAEDNESASNALTIKVWGYNEDANLISENSTDLSVTNPAPDNPQNLTSQPFISGVTFSWDIATEVDFSYWAYKYKVCTYGLDDGSWTADWINTNENHYSHKLSASEIATYGSRPDIYFKIVAYDSFGSASTESSTSDRALSLEYGDTDPPGIPTGLSLSSSTVIDNDGHEIVVLTADWDDNTESDLAYYEWAIKEDGGNYVFGIVGESKSEWRSVKADTKYYVKVRASDITGNWSGYCGAVDHTTTKDTTAPSAPTGLAAAGSFNSIWLTWTNPVDSDFSHTEVWRSNDNNRNNASKIAELRADWYEDTDIGYEVTKYYWVRALDYSGNESTWHPVSSVAGISATTVYVGSGDVITASALITVTAQIQDAVITNAKISDLHATKINAGDIATARMQVNAAGAVNAGSVTIEPGKITISGATSLSDWRQGGDTAKIAGGYISANTISANKISIGSRNVTFDGIAFSANKDTNNITWLSGTVSYTNDAGSVTSANISSGNQTCSSGTYYFYWVKDATAISNTTNRGTAYAADNLVIASYVVTTQHLIVTYAKTIIDGSDITANTITANEIAADTITAAQIAANTITASEINVTNFLPLPSDEHLVGYWPFDDGSGAVAVDASGNDNDGTLVNMEDADWKDGVVGKCLDFDGTNEYVDCGTIGPVTTDKLTISFWTNNEIHTNTNRNPILEWYTSPGERLILVKQHASLRRFAIYNSSWRFFSTAYYPTGTTKEHIVITISGTSATLCISGIEKQTISIGTAYTEFSGSFRIGSFMSGVHFLKGPIDELRVYDTALTASEIKALYLYPAGSGGTRISGNQITTGVIQSTNWAVAAGMQIDLDNATIKIREADGLTIAHGADVLLEHGGDIKFTSVTAPTACTGALAGAGAGNVNNGDHYYKIIYVNAVGETELGAISNLVTVADKAADGQVSLTGIPVSSSSSVTKRKIYRTKAGASIYYYLNEIANNTGTTYTDNIADASLGSIEYNNKVNNTSGKLYIDGISSMSLVASNAFIGQYAGANNSTGYANTAIGSYGLTANTIGTRNTAMGNRALYANTTGDKNTAIGYDALYSNVSGSENVALGRHAGRYELGDNAFYVNNQDRINTAGDKSKSILYGVMATFATNQTLIINAVAVVSETLKITERAAAKGDTAGMGQLWVKNTTPCQLWFTDDAGTDTQIV